MRSNPRSDGGLGQRCIVPNRSARPEGDLMIAVSEMARIRTTSRGGVFDAIGSAPSWLPGSTPASLEAGNPMLRTVCQRAT